MARILDKATITSIDRTTGRIGLFLRNGLETTGTYLYDIKDLRVGMVVIVGRVNNAYMIFQNMSNNMPAVATKSYGNLGYSNGLACVDYIESDVAQWNDDFSSVEVDTDKWITDDIGSLVRSYFYKPPYEPYYTCYFFPMSFGGVPRNYDNLASYLKQIDGKLLYDKFYTEAADEYGNSYSSRWSGTISQYSAPGDFSVTFKFIMMKNNIPRPFYNMFYIYMLPTHYGQATCPSALVSELAQTFTAFVKFERIGTIWYFYIKVNLTDSWVLIKTLNDPLYFLPGGSAKILMIFNNVPYYDLPEYLDPHNNYPRYEQIITIAVFVDYVFPESWWDSEPAYLNPGFSFSIAGGNQLL